MSSAALDALVAIFRSNESSYMHTAVVLIGDSAAQKIVSAWTTSPIVWKAPPTAQPTDDHELWDWAWEGVVVEWTDLSKRSGLPISRLTALFETLRSNRLIYPDGTAANHAIGVLKAEVMKTIKNFKK